MALNRYDEDAGGWVPWQQTDEEAREWARDYGGNDSWYWSPKWQTMTSITDGIMTVRDVANALARGDDSPEIARLAADYWLMIGHHVQTGAAAAVGAARWAAVEGTADEDGYYPEPSPAAAARIEAAEGDYATMSAIVDDLTEASRAAWAAETDAQDAAKAAEAQDAAEVARVYDYLFVADHYAVVEHDEEEASYRASIYQDAQTLVASGYTAANLAELDDEARAGTGTPGPRGTHTQSLAAGEADDLAAAPGVALDADPVQHCPEIAWREGCQQAYTEHIVAYGNDGRPEDDRSTTPHERARFDTAVAEVAEWAGTSEGMVRAQMREAAYLHGQDTGTDADPDRFAPPEWVLTGAATDGAGFLPEVAAEIADYVWSPEHYASLTDESARAQYIAGCVEDGQQLAAAGYTVTQLEADDAAIRAAEPPTDLEPSMDILRAEWPANPELAAGDFEDYRHDRRGSQLYAQMLLEEARLEVEAGIDVGQVADADAVLAEMADGIAGSSQEHERAAAGDPAAVKAADNDNVAATQPHIHNAILNSAEWCGDEEPHSDTAGAKLPLTGDHRQLAAVAAVTAGESADDVLAELIADLDATAPDPYPCDDTADHGSNDDDAKPDAYRAAHPHEPAVADPARPGELAAAAVAEARERYAEYDGGDSDEIQRLDQAVMAAEDAVDQGARVGISGRDGLPELAVQESSVADDDADFEYLADPAGGRETAELDPDGGGSPAKPRSADASADLPPWPPDVAGYPQDRHSAYLQETRAQERVLDAAGSLQLARTEVLSDSLGTAAAAERVYAAAAAELDALATDDTQDTDGLDKDTDPDVSGGAWGAELAAAGDDGESRGKSAAAQAVAAAHGAVQADTQRAAGYEVARAVDAHASDRVQLPGAAEQAPTMERGA